MSPPPDSLAPVARSRRPLLLGAGLSLLFGGAGFYAGWAGLLPPGTGPAAHDGAATPAVPALAYVPIDPITINLGQRGQTRHLRFAAQLEVVPAQAAEVVRLMPRIVDVLNTYLRALDLPELEAPSALTRLRGQMLRRIQIVTGPGRVTDLLVMEFVFN